MRMKKLQNFQTDVTTSFSHKLILIILVGYAQKSLCSFHNIFLLKHELY